MNRPSRTDDAESKHPDWNQNPPFLAADLTTCEDLNGIANLRECEASGDEAREWPPDAMFDHLDNPPDGVGTAVTMARSSFGLASPKRTVAGGDGCNRLELPYVSYAPDMSSVWSWVTWGCSVIVSAFLLSAFSRNRELHVQQGSAANDFNRHPSAPLRKRATCPNSVVSRDLYNTPLHVGALFIVLFVSTVACSFPMLAARFPGLRLPGRFFFIVRHFGTGVLLATAFAHLLPTAFISLGDPCLSGFWTEDYPAMPGAIAMAGIFLVAVVEMVFHPARLIRSEEEDGSSGQDRATTDEVDTPQTAPGSPIIPVREMRPLGGRTSSIGRTLSRVNDRNIADQNSSADEGPAAKERSAAAEEEARPESPVVMLTPEQKHRKAILQCVLLEVGILFHSIFIGMALSVSYGSDFVTLLIAIVFHQTFEGLALGSRIASIDWPKKTMKPWLMALAYGCTTPIGQAIGLATSSLYSPDSETGLLVVGTMNAVSAGLLIFASLVELLSEDFLSDESWKVLMGMNRVIACLLVFFGAFSMSLVGAWA